MSDNIYKNNEESTPEYTNSEFGDQLHISRSTFNDNFGKVIELKKDYCKTIFVTSNDMRYDDEGLVNGTYIFIGADYAAHTSINMPYCVTIGSKVSFLAPIKVGDIVTFEAKAFFEESKKREVKVNGYVNEIKVFEGKLQIVVLENHIFKIYKKEEQTKG